MVTYQPSPSVPTGTRVRPQTAVRAYRTRLALCDLAKAGQPIQDRYRNVHRCDTDVSGVTYVRTLAARTYGVFRSRAVLRPLPRPHFLLLMTASITLFAMGAARPPPEMSSRLAFSSSTTTATATGELLSLCLA
ncbi:Hypothetical Protein sle_35710 [Streptomyces leeuwenhoekii]|uniref:Uncharacterized protein n=1 Tax=Streptomyces leeuwenhoekii TaxID=1437453 RepID=A0A0F7VZQ5_STRLW|nr:Hypothetical Protein sle_35710 [Streptomyces leeuwenhoekii]